MPASVSITLPEIFETFSALVRAACVLCCLHTSSSLTFTQVVEPHALRMASRTVAAMICAFAPCSGFLGPVQLAGPSAGESPSISRGNFCCPDYVLSHMGAAAVLLWYYSETEMGVL